MVRCFATMNGPKRSASHTIPEPRTHSGDWPRLRGVFALILSTTLIVYLPALRGAFLWDDAGHVTSPQLQSWSGLLRIWFEPGVTQQYYPLLHSAFWLEHRLWGDATLGYHLINVLWHATSACLLVAVLRRLAVPGALLAGLLFALHPVCVESVAWISEQKNTLSMVFYLAAALAWLRFEQERTRRRYLIATLWFLAALLTKTVTATLPAALLVVAWWRCGRSSPTEKTSQRGKDPQAWRASDDRLWWRGDVLPLLPWFGMGIVAGLFTVWFERTGIGAQGSDFNLSLGERGLLAGRVVWFYFSKLIWPADLVFFYPRWRIDASAAWHYAFVVAALALLGGLAWWARLGRGRGLLAAFLLFGGTLFPVLGFVNVYPFVFSYVADHFQYHASLGLFALGGAAFAGGVQRGWFGVTRHRPRVIAGGLLLAIGVLSWRSLRAPSSMPNAPTSRRPVANTPSPRLWLGGTKLSSPIALKLRLKACRPNAPSQPADSRVNSRRPSLLRLVKVVPTSSPSNSTCR